MVLMDSSQLVAGPTNPRHIIPHVTTTIHPWDPPHMYGTPPVPLTAHLHIPCGTHLHGRPSHGLDRATCLALDYFDGRWRFGNCLSGLDRLDSLPRTEARV